MVDFCNCSIYRKLDLVFCSIFRLVLELGGCRLDRMGWSNLSNKRMYGKNLNFSLFILYRFLVF